MGSDHRGFRKEKRNIIPLSGLVLVTILLFFLAGVGIVQAVLPLQVTVTANPPTLLPGGAEAQIAVLVKAGEQVVEGATVTLRTDSELAIVNPASSTTDSSGMVFSTFSTLSNGGSIRVTATARKVDMEMRQVYEGQGYVDVPVQGEVPPVPPPPPPVTHLPPVAVISVDQYAGVVPLTVMFDGRGSTDPDGIITQYGWDLGDGESGTGYVKYHTYPNPGTYHVTLNVVDNDGMISSADVTITAIPLEGPAPQACADGYICMSQPEAEGFFGSDNYQMGTDPTESGCGKDASGNVQHCFQAKHRCESPECSCILEEEARSYFGESYTKCSPKVCGFGYLRTQPVPKYCFEQHQWCLPPAVDPDHDCVAEATDNCPGIYNPDQKDTDKDTVGDACDNCPSVPNRIQKNLDSDQWGDACDNCPEVGNDDQADKGEITCENAGTELNPVIQCKGTPDGVGDACDNCPHDFNPRGLDGKQLDSDHDGVGDTCDKCPEFDDNQDRDKDGIPDKCDNCQEIANKDQQDSDHDGFGDTCDNCWSIKNPDQHDSDKDGVGDVCEICTAPGNKDSDGDGMVDPCDICPGHSDFEDRDADGVPDGCDNCPEKPNQDQRDVNGDGVGDACDCHDGFMGPNEAGGDCGGICSISCPLCVPLFVQGSHSDKIDVVFIGNESYANDLTGFINDAKKMVFLGYFGDPLLNANRKKFNFYYYSLRGEVTGLCRNYIPQKLWSDCSFADTVVLVHPRSRYIRDCTVGKVISAPMPSFDTLVTSENLSVLRHESGHSLFGLVDEYCCDGYYEQVDSNPNIYSSLPNCIDDAPWLGFSGVFCWNFCPANNGCQGSETGYCCGDGWWKVDSAQCTMQHNGPTFEAGCRRRISAVFSNYKD